MKKRYCSTFKQSTTEVKDAKVARGLSKKTRWAYWIQAIEPTSAAIEVAFPGYYPLWVQHSQRLAIAPANFRHMREHCLAITRAQAAAYLRVEAADVEAWERGDCPIPFMAFELLRLVFESVAYRLSHAKWDGWFIDWEGRFVSLDTGKLAVTPAEASYLPSLLNQIDTLQAEARRLKTALDAQEAENARLRALHQGSGLAAELEAMQARLGDLLASIQTAQVIPFPVQSNRLEAAA